MNFVTEWRRSLRIYWYRTDRAAWVLAGIIGVFVAVFGFALSAVFAQQDARRERALAMHRQNLECLARNV